MAKKPLLRKKKIFPVCLFICYVFFFGNVDRQDATVKLPADKAATREDAEGVMSAEMRNTPDMTAHPVGVSASIAAAANINEKEHVIVG